MGREWWILTKRQIMYVDIKLNMSFGPAIGLFYVLGYYTQPVLFWRQTCSFVSTKGLCLVGADFIPTRHTILWPREYNIFIPPVTSLYTNSKQREQIIILVGAHFILTRQVQYYDQGNTIYSTGHFIPIQNKENK